MTQPGDGLYSIRAAEVLLGQQRVYPNGADGVVLSSDAATDWVQGTITEIIPDGTISELFVLTAVDTIIVGAKHGAYQLDLYYGPSDIFLCSVLFSYFAGELKEARALYGALAGAPIPADSRIRGKLRYGGATASGAGASQITLTYVEISG